MSALCGSCGHPKQWSGPSHYPGCIRVRYLKHRSGKHPVFLPRLRADEPHPVCYLAFMDGGTPCSYCQVLLCSDERCEHEACARDRYEEAH